MVDVPIASPDIGEAECERVQDVLESGELAGGAEVRSFEREFGEYVDADHAVATANGTAALHTALEAVDVEPGRYVVTTPFSFVATANAIRLAGGIPLFADIDPETYNLDPHSVEETIESADGHVDAIVAVHLYGLPADMDHLRDIADTHDIPLVEDAAQAHGARYDGRPVGSIGDVGCFSFYPTKNMTTGEGGMVTTDRDDVAERAARFVDHGRGEDTYEHVELGHNYRMTNIAAAIGRVQLTKLPEYISARRSNAVRLTDRLEDAPVVLPHEPPDRTHVYHQYTIRCEEREHLRPRLDRADVDSAVYYPTCIPQLDAYSHLRETDIAPPPDQIRAATRAADEVLSLPIHPGVSEEDVDRIASAVRDAEVKHEWA